MKLKINWVLGALAVLLLALAVAPWTVSQEAQIVALRRQIRERAGLDLTAHGRSVFAVLPRPHIRIYDPNLRGVDGDLTVSAGSLRVDLGLSGLLTGRLELARAVLTEAVFTIDAERLPQLVADAATAAPEAPGSDIGKLGVGRFGDGKVGDVQIGDVEISDGKVFLRHIGGALPDLAADDVQARLAWSRADAPLSLIGHARFSAFGEGHEPTRFALWAAQPARLLQPGGGPVGTSAQRAGAGPGRAGASAITLRFDDESLQIALNGALTLGPRPRFDGQVVASAASLRTATGWFGVPLPLPGPYRDARLKADATLDAGQLGLTNLTVTIDGNTLDGAIFLRFDGQRPSVSATLAGASVNFGPLLEDYPAATAANGEWNRDAFPPPHLAAADLDLRLSATRARLGDFQLEDAALSVILKGGRLDVSLAQAKAYAGVARARAVIAENDGGLDIRGSLAADKLDVAPLLWDGAKRQILTGSGGLSSTFETNGASFAELATHLDARGDFSVVSGEIYGLDLGLAFRRMERRPLSVGADLRSGRTDFDLLSGKFNIVQGAADIEEGVVRNSLISMFFSGRAQISDRTADLHASANRAEPDGKALQFGFSMTGPWDDPAVTPDAEGLIRRSDAAAPLLPPAVPPN
jgi:AsmA protein